MVGPAIEHVFWPKLKKRMMDSSRDDKDSQLVSLLVTGDREAFAAIYQTYAGPLIHYARKTIHAKEDCEEIVQEIFESLWARKKTCSMAGPTTDEKTSTHSTMRRHKFGRKYPLLL